MAHYIQSALEAGRDMATSVTSEADEAARLAGSLLYVATSTVLPREAEQLVDALAPFLPPFRWSAARAPEGPPVRTLAMWHRDVDRFRDNLKRLLIEEMHDAWVAAGGCDKCSGTLWILCDGKRPVACQRCAKKTIADIDPGFSPRRFPGANAIRLNAPIERMRRAVAEKRGSSPEWSGLIRLHAAFWEIRRSSVINAVSDMKFNP